MFTHTQAQQLFQTRLKMVLVRKGDNQNTHVVYVERELPVVQKQLTVILVESGHTNIVLGF
ncbi:hypothetical protein DPMN_012001 [Dreissena polymorpha]|uniref:Uncharacterized protein n=1 Tax=Dreissena polymorpha TaxID=45954 RepID=A0A9D4N658_DREPO|nr:hypothetical protein DPMN_012001 [Dreissena polymorpha]